MFFQSHLVPLLMLLVLRGFSLLLILQKEHFKLHFLVMEYLRYGGKTDKNVNELGKGGANTEDCLYQVVTESDKKPVQPSDNQKPACDFL